MSKLKQKVKKFKERASTLKKKNADLCDALRSKLSDPKYLEDTKRRESVESLDSDEDEFDRSRPSESQNRNSLRNEKGGQFSGVFPSIDAHLEVGCHNVQSNRPNTPCTVLLSLLRPMNLVLA